MELGPWISDVDPMRLVSAATHAILGANAALGADANPFMGVVNGLVLDSVAHSRFAESIGGGAALAAGYGLLAVGNLNHNFDKLIPVDLLKWLALPKWGAEYRARGGTFEDYMGTREQQRQEFGPKGLASTPPATIDTARLSGVDRKAERWV